MEDLLKSIPVPAVFCREQGSEMVFNEKARQVLRNSDLLAETLRRMLQAASANKVEGHYYDFCTVGEKDCLAFVYRLGDEGYLLMLQELSKIEHILAKVPFIAEMKNELAGILEAAYDDYTITDGRGVILRVRSSSFEKFYGVPGETVLGKSVFELERLGIFRPSVIAEALRTGGKITMVQENKFNCQIVTTAVPVRDATGQISKILSFSHDITEFYKIKDQYEELEKKIKLYSAELEELRSKDTNFPNVISRSKEIQEVLRLVNKVADFDANVLLCGESGVGKTLFARLIHSRSKRSGGTLIEVNCGAIPENLLESELFGYEAGAFTGAKREGKIGLIELAQNGTLFLDEISELPLNLQVKLLKVIQDKTITRVGGTKPITVDFRLIAATNRDLEVLTAQKRFREDLYYRLNVMTIKIPPLRERKDDIFPLSLHFVEMFNKKYKLNKSLAPSTIDRLVSYNWPGNIRELENVIERALLTSEHKIVTEVFLPENIRFSQGTTFRSEDCGLQEALENLEREMVLKAYDRYGTTVGVAKALGISQATAVRKIQKYTRGYSTSNNTIHL